jgi:hypothetical protein
MAVVRVVTAATIGMGMVAAMVFLGFTAVSGVDTADAVEVPGIPVTYLRLYQQAAHDYDVDWAVLAGIGRVETDHGRVQNGGCAVSSAGARGPMQFMPGTWADYGAGGNICDPVDAIPAAARYLRASGAPGDYHAAILAYNHSEQYYTDVMNQARAYRAAVPKPGGQSVGAVPGADWLAQVPGTTFQCDQRIVPDVEYLIGRYHLTLTACYAATGHEAGGEHPLGLAVDVVPAPPASWGMLDRLARDMGWSPACAFPAGCPGPVFRFIGWNGYPGHGDPAHAGGNAHLHLSWAHGPGVPAATVRVLAR